MKHVLRILPAADADVEAAALFIAQGSIDSALRFYDAVDETYRQIRAYPTHWPRYDLGHPHLINLRKRAVKGFGNYLVFYRVETRVVEVIRVLHGARDIPSVLSDES